MKEFGLYMLGLATMVGLVAFFVLVVSPHCSPL
jgi:hypothetical protein